MENLYESTERTIGILKNAIIQSKKDDRILKTVSKLLNVEIYTKRNEEGKHERILAVTKLNGIIFDSDGNVICRPVRRVTYDKSPQEIQRDVMPHNYKIYYAINGSVITYYYYMGSWRISSSTGIDLNFEILIGEMTFKQIFDELLEENNISSEAFEEHNCYTFVISHPHYHILPFKKIILIGGYNFKTKKYFDAKGSSMEKIGQVVRPLGDKRSVVEKLFSEASISIDTYMQKQDMDYPKLFGYVLRTSDPECVDYYIRSDLMAIMKNGVFSTYRSVIGKNDRRAYFMLNIWLIGRNEAFWYKIFGEEYEKYSNVFTNMVTSICEDLDKIREKNIRLESSRSTTYTEILMKFINLGIRFANIREVGLLDSLFAVYLESNKIEIKARD